MSFTAALQELSSLDAGACLQALGSVVDREWVTKALEEGNAVTLRRRKLPAESVVWLVLGMGLFRDHSIADVVRRLDLVWRGAKSKKGKVVDGALPSARRRVGEKPLKALFSLCAENWGREAADRDRWLDLSVFAMDGTSLSVPDTEDNREGFGLPGSSRGQAGYPQLRLVTLMAARSHLVVGAAMGGIRGKGTGERTLASELWQRVPDDAVVIVDRGFIDYGQFHRFSTSGTNRHWLVRTRRDARYKTVAKLGDGDELAEVKLTHHTRSRDPSLPKKMLLRVIHYQVDGEPRELMTSLLDAQRWPADKVLALYHERWEIEISFDELKTHLLERKESLRSKSPQGVRQEVWGILIAYNLIRKRMAMAAQKLEIQPRSMSFVYSLRLVRAFFLATAWEGSPANIPKHLETLDEELESATLPARRSKRNYKRWVKVKMSNYKRNPGKPLQESHTEEVSVPK